MKFCLYFLHFCPELDAVLYRRYTRSAAEMLRVVVQIGAGKVRLCSRKCMKCSFKFSSTHRKIWIKFGPSAIQQYVDWFATILSTFGCASSWKLTAFSQFREHKGLSTGYCTWKAPARSANHYVLRHPHVINAHLTTWVLFGRCLLLTLNLLAPTTVGARINP